MSVTERLQDEDSLISRSTILILSGFLIGLSTGHFTGEEMQFPILACGLAGCLAFIVLDISATRRMVCILKEEQIQMEKRLDKHLTSLNHSTGTAPLSQVSAKLSLTPLREDDTELLPADGQRQ